MNRRIKYLLFTVLQIYKRRVCDIETASGFGLRISEKGSKKSVPYSIILCRGILVTCERPGRSGHKITLLLLYRSNLNKETERHSSSQQSVAVAV